MIYFDNAATSYPKPKCVKDEMIKVLKDYGGNPGRGGYPLAHKTARYLYETRKVVAEFLGASKSSQIIFTLNATEAANIVLQGFLNPGEHCIYFSAEHNGNFRPLKALESRGIALSKVNIYENEETTLKGLQSALRQNTKLVVAIYGSNVTGQILPLSKIVEIAHKSGIAVYSDMAQTAGFLPTDLTALDVDFAAFAGHKSFLGPAGVGFLYCKEEGLLRPLKTGGTGGNSLSPYMPEAYPDAMECGTLNLAGIGGLRAGIHYLKKQGEENIFRHEQELTRYFIKESKKIPGVILYGPDENALRLPVVSLNVEGYSPEYVGEQLVKHGDIAVRTGLHCAPLAHETIGTLPGGTVRFSFGYFNTKREIDVALMTLRKIKRKKAES